MYILLSPLCMIRLFFLSQSQMKSLLFHNFLKWTCLHELQIASSSGLCCSVISMDTRCQSFLRTVEGVRWGWQQRCWLSGWGGRGWRCLGRVSYQLWKSANSQSWPMRSRQLFNNSDVMFYTFLMCNSFSIGQVANWLSCRLRMATFWLLCTCMQSIHLNLAIYVSFLHHP